MIDRIRVLFRMVPKHIWVLAFIVLIGIFFRIYHFHDWLPFKGDGFRDAIMVSNSYRVGIESLPLLGPRAAGTMLRLGPVFYYFQYTAVSMFDSMSAPVLAYPDVFFSILAIPLFYFFARRYFGIPWSLVLASMLATSFLAIEYGRFAWNPNSTIFFILAFSLAFLRIYDAPDDASRKRYFPALLAGVFLGVATQLHFSSFLGLPIVIAFFLLWRFPDTKKVISLKVIACFLVSFLLIYTPVLMSEYFKHGENSKRFISALESKPSVHGAKENITRIVRVFANQNIRITLGIVEPGKKMLLFSAFFLALGFLANMYLIRGERNESRRNFLQWTLLLIIVYFILYIPLAFTVDRPRFFLPFMMIPYLYCGYIILALEKRFGRKMFLKILAIIGVSIVILSNMHSVLGWFAELRQSEQITESAGTGEKNIKGRSFWLVWTHFERAASAMDNSCQGTAPIFFFPSKNIKEYGHSIEYALLLGNPDRPIVLERKYDPIVLDGCYFFVSLPHNGVMPELMASEPADEPLDLGGILLTRFYPVRMSGTYEPDKDDEKEITFVPEKRTRNSRVYWGDIFNLLRGEK